MKHYLAIDLGASGGKIFCGFLSDKKLVCEEVHRFSHNTVEMNGRLYWDLPLIYHEILVGLTAAGRKYESIDSVAVDCWCNDYALLTKNGTMLETPRCYRDKRTRGLVKRSHEIMDKLWQFERTGQQFARFETCYHLMASYEQDPDIMGIGHKLVFMADYISHLLGSALYTEYTVASVTNLFNITSGEWDGEILQKLGMNRDLFLPIVFAGDKVGEVSENIARGRKTDILAVGSHDTACAVAAAPSFEEDFIYISSGTWSLVGTELDEPILCADAMEKGFGNEGGVMGKTRLIRNVMGLWILQECLRAWNREGKNLTFEELIRLARETEYSRPFDPDDERFFEPENMLRAVENAIEKPDGAPLTVGEIVKSIIESLACKYRYVIDLIESLTGKRYGSIHILGGGCNNALLNELTASYTNKKVVAGPSDATAAGNILVQMIGKGEISGLKEARKICANSFDLAEYLPKDAELYDKKYADFLRALEQAV